jgi:antitoxin (DNA-binding transcriptional repressor) of toxin-antitoxin stability system
MITTTISYTKNHLSELLASVRQGETLIIMDRKKPVARVEAIETLADHPHLNPALKKWQPAAILELPLADALPGSNTLTQAVAEERQSGW